MGPSQVTGCLSKPVGDRKRRDQKPRVTPSCNLCRQRKLRCNRQLPCGNCANRNEESSCQYTANHPIRSAEKRPNLPSRIRYLEDRIKQLEKCIGGQASPTRLRNITPDNDMRRQGTPTSSPANGLLLSGPSGTRYINSANWQTIMNACNDLWKDPTEVSPAWLAFLYGIMSCAVWIDHTTNQATSKVSVEVPETFDFYRKCCALCLTRSNYTTPGRCKVEALGLYLGLEYLSCNNLKTSVLVLLGICIRLAIMMRYHQYSESYPHISVFEAEMRRRTWLFLQISDSIVSCQTGVPRVISRRLGNTALPRDLLDTSFGPTTVELPPPQSETQRPTNITYIVAIWRIMEVSNEMMDTLSFKTLSYDETLQLNHDLEVARDHIPPLLRMQATDLSCPITDTDIIIERHALETTFQRARCILHRQYLLANRAESKYDVSMPRSLFQEIIPCVRQHRRAWFGASMSITDCLTAAMIICFEIITLSQAEQTLHAHANRMSGLIELLRNLYNTWKIAPELSFATSQPADILAAMFKLVQSGDPNLTLGSSGPFRFNEHDIQTSPEHFSEQLKEEMETTDPLTLGCLQDLLNTDWEFEMFDWGLWDREMQELNGIISNN
ncbi:hypothetical protein N7486_007231 [Penicillium sp. IBT 16267x]|nr:hypothetical protein N7486_007231 [Penicillium sp. IBT 16267x]